MSFSARRSLLTTLALSTCLSGITACGSKPATTAPASGDVWATVDGRSITKAAVEQAYRRTSDPAATPTDDEVMTAKLALLNDLITQDVLLAKAKALSIDVTPAEVETTFNERKQGMADDAFQKQLSQRGLTLADMKENLRREMVVQKLLEREVSAKVTVTEQAISDYFNSHRAQFNLAEPAYHIAQIVITPVREEQIANRLNDDATSAEAAGRKAKMLADRLAGGNVKFSELAMDYSEDPQSAPAGGDLGFLPASQLAQAPAPLRDAVLKAQPGTISQISANGAHTLVLLVAKEAAGQRELSSPGVRDNITADLRGRQEELLRAAYLTSIRDDAQIANGLAKQIVTASSKTAPPVAPAAPGSK